MTLAQTQISANSSRLVRSLAELVGTGAAVSHKHFTERLGQLFDLPDSIRLSAVHERAPAAAFAPPATSREAAKEEFLRARASIVSSALGRFTPGGGSLRLRFPVATADMTPEEIVAPEPYLAFYAAQQRDIDFRIRNLQAATRDAIAVFSPGLARLAALDAALADPLAAPARRLFAAVPRLLQRRFGILLEDYRREIGDRVHSPDRWDKTIGQFRDEMRGLLLAEIETRLLPALGLIEALDEHQGE
jgi:hypothetical protein